MPRRKTTATEPESATQPAGQGGAPAAQGNLAKLQAILREIFQFDSADLDFGIYRILNFKRDAIQRFLEQDLPQTVSAELAKGALATESAAERELKDLERQVRETLGEEALSPDGALQEAFHGTNLGKQYLSAQERAVGAKGREALEALVFSHLHSFFSRYYDSGDFLSKRRYSKNQRYAIPYNGEEVYLHWANSDQYYIKTLEHFTNYTFRSLGFTVHFLLRSAQAETDGSQQERRFFLPLVHEAAFDAKTMEATIPFEHRPLTTKEQITYGGRSQQESILSTALEVLPKALRGHPELLDALLHEERRGSNGQPVSCIAHHLTRYTQRNTSDFFIHKDLKGFLEKELDFYIKNEVLSVDELEAAGEQRAEGWFQILSVLRTIGRRIIAFLAQIEDFQKKLYEKKKFITETNYLITLQAVPERLLAEIAGNDVQWQEWKELYRIDENQRNLFTPNGKQARRIAFLKANPTLVVDTKLFSEDFTDRLLASFDDLDGNLAGLLVHSENFQALNALLQRYGGSVACVYIDPPYNSKTTAILYKNDYKHSSWLSLMDNRLALSKRLAATNGSHVVAIDENEQEVLGRLLSSHFADYTRVCVAVVHNKKGIQGDYFSFNHDYAYFCIPPSVPETHGKPIPESEWEYMNLRKWGRESERSTAKNCFYPIYVKGSEIVGFGEVCDDTFHPRQANVRQSEGIVAVYPIDGQGVERVPFTKLLRLRRAPAARRLGSFG